MKPCVAVATPVDEPPEVLARMEREFTLVHIPAEDNRPAGLDSVAEDIEALVTTSHDGVPEWVWSLPNLKVIGNYGVGYDGIDTGRAAGLGVWVTNTPNVLNDEVADLAMGLMLSVVRKIVGSDRYVRAGRWVSEGNCPLLRGHVHGSKLGLLGMGGIGQEIARRAEAFKMEISYTCRNPKQVPWRYEKDLVELAKWCDILCCIVPGGDETRNLVGSEELEALGPDGYLVNVARGSVVDERELVKSLQAGAIAGAGLDVYANEPEVPEELFGLDNVVLLPHIGSATVHTRAAMGYLVIDNILSILAGGPPLTPVNDIEKS